MKGISDIDRVQVLIEALPYIRTFYGRNIVIKYGGHAMVKDDLKESFARDVVLLKYVGINPIVVHGGGPQIGSMLKRIGKESLFKEGMRVTDEETMNIVEMVLAGRVNKEIVNLIQSYGGKAVGLSGKDTHLIEANKMHIFKYQGDDRPPEIIDIGLVGEVKKINLDILKILEQSQIIPVVAPVGVGPNGETFNINADLVAGAIASELKASKLILMTDVPGVVDSAGNMISSMTVTEALELIENGTVKGGMIPKLKCAIEAVQSGVEKVHIIDGRIPHSVLLEIFTDSGIGTEVTREEKAK